MGRKLNLEEMKGREGSISFKTAFLCWSESLRGSVYSITGARLGMLKYKTEEIILIWHSEGKKKINNGTVQGSSLRHMEMV